MVRLVASAHRVRKPLQTEPAKCTDHRRSPPYMWPQENLDSAIQDSTENEQRHLLSHWELK